MYEYLESLHTLVTCFLFFCFVHPHYILLHVLAIFFFDSVLFAYPPTRAHETSLGISKIVLLCGELFARIYFFFFISTPFVAYSCIVGETVICMFECMNIKLTFE